MRGSEWRLHKFDTKSRTQTPRRIFQLERWSWWQAFLWGVLMRIGMLRLLTGTTAGLWLAGCNTVNENHSEPPILKAADAAANTAIPMAAESDTPPSVGARSINQAMSKMAVVIACVFGTSKYRPSALNL